MRSSHDPYRNLSRLLEALVPTGQREERAAVLSSSRTLVLFFIPLIVASSLIVFIIPSRRDLPRLLEAVVSTDQKEANTQLSFEETYADISPVRKAGSESAFGESFPLL